MSSLPIGPCTEATKEDENGQMHLATAIAREKALSEGDTIVLEVVTACQQDLAMAIHKMKHMARISQEAHDTWKASCVDVERAEADALLAQWDLASVMDHARDIHRKLVHLQL